MKEELEMYCVRNKDGKWLRSKGYSGFGSSWVDSLKKAKIYGTLKGPRTQVTYWSTHYPEYGVPDIVKLKVVATETINEEERVKQATLKRKRAELVAEKNRIKYDLKSKRNTMKSLEKQIQELEERL